MRCLSRSLRFPTRLPILPALAWSLLAACLAGHGMGVGAQDEPRSEEPSPAALKPLAELARGLKVDVRKLAGSDAQVGAFEAHGLLGEVLGGDEASRAAHHAFLREILDASALSRLPPVPVPEAAERVLAAQRIVEAIALRIRDAGPPLQGMADLLLPLLGKGPRPLRDAVVAALRALVASDPSALDRIVSVIGHNPPPSPSLLEDASTLLWEADGKRFIGHAIEGMLRNRDKAPESTALYLRELRARLYIDASTPEQWETWWEANAARPFEAIVLDCQRKLSADQAALWRQTLRRITEAGDAERLLGELQTVIESTYTPEMRMAAVGALADYPEWIRLMKVPGATPADTEKARSALLGRACDLLLRVSRGEIRADEFPEARRAAFMALRRYQQFLEREAPPLRTRIDSLVAARLQDLHARRPASAASAGWDLWRTDLLEVVRTAGALKVLETRGLVEDVLDDPLLGTDRELSRAAVEALGRLVKGGIGLETTHLLLRHFQGAAALPGGTGLELRAACAAALDARPEDEAVRDLLRSFHMDALQQSREPKLHIPAIGGLSTLVQEEDARALEALVAVLSSPEAFDTQALIAVINAVAYVGGRGALEQFLPFLKPPSAAQGKEKDVAEHLRLKVEGIIAPEGIAGVAWLLDRLEDQAYQKDDLGYLVYGVDLVRSPRLSGLLLTDAASISALNGQLEAVWQATLCHLRAVDLTAGEPAASDLYSRVRGVLEKEVQLKEKAPESAAEFEVRLALHGQRARIRARLADREKIDLAALLGDCAELLRISTAARGGETAAAGSRREVRDRWASLRWVERLVSSPEARSAIALRPFYDLWATYLSSAENRSVWDGLPEGFRASYLRRLETLRASPPAPGGAKE